MKIKGFDKNLCCRGMQFEIGKEYDTGAKDQDIRLCSNTVFHYCDSIQKVHHYYNCDIDNRFCEIEVLGEEITDGEKCGSNKIKIIREITGGELDILLGKTNGNTGLFNSGARNSGYRNSGDMNSGDMNSGYMNSGYMNSGNMNSGAFNSCNYSSGIFCSREEKIRIFNKPSEMTASEFYNSKYWSALTSADFTLTEWISYKAEDITTEAKKATGGYLKTYTYKEACANWWGKLIAEAKETILEMPNFDANVFYEITGIKIDDAK